MGHVWDEGDFLNCLCHGLRNLVGEVTVQRL